MARAGSVTKRRHAHRSDERMVDSGGRVFLRKDGETFHRVGRAGEPVFGAPGPPLFGSVVAGSWHGVSGRIVHPLHCSAATESLEVWGVNHPQLCSEQPFDRTGGVSVWLNWPVRPVQLIVVPGPGNRPSTQFRRNVTISCLGPFARGAAAAGVLVRRDRVKHDRRGPKLPGNRPGRCAPSGFGGFRLRKVVCR